MKKRYFLFTTAFILLGEVALSLFAYTVGNINIGKEALLLALAFLCSFFIHFTNKVLEKFQKKYFSIEFIFLTALLFYLMYNFRLNESALVNFGYLLIYAMIVCACFIFRDLIAHLYMQCTAFLAGLTLFFGDSFWVGAIFLIFFVIAVALHNDYLNIRTTRKILPVPVVSLLLLPLGAFLLYVWMDFTNSWADKFIREYWQESLSSQSFSGLNLFQESSDLQMAKELKFPDVNIDKMDSKTLFEVNIGQRDRSLLDNYQIPLLWKSMALDDYSPQQQKWSCSKLDMRHLNDAGTGSIFLGRGLGHQLAKLRIQQQFRVNTTMQDAILSLGIPTVVGYPAVRQDEDGNLFPAASPAPSYYVVIGEIPIIRNSRGLSLAKTSPRHLTPPLEHRDYFELAMYITRGIAHPYEKVKAIEEYLQSNYEYNLSPKYDKSQDSTYQFLFGKDGGKGHCQHFSSAMALLLRSIGIPSRIAIGFRGGVWSSAKRSYVVSNMHAHAWVEVKFNETDWYPFDPTAPASSDLEQKFQEKIAEATKESPLDDLHNQNRLQENPLETEKKRIDKQGNYIRENQEDRLAQQERRNNSRNKRENDNKRRENDNKRWGNENGENGPNGENRGNGPNGENGNRRDPFDDNENKRKNPFDKDNRNPLANKDRKNDWNLEEDKHQGPIAGNQDGEDPFGENRNSRNNQDKNNNRKNSWRDFLEKEKKRQLAKKNKDKNKRFDDINRDPFNRGNNEFANNDFEKEQKKRLAKKNQEVRNDDLAPVGTPDRNRKKILDRIRKQSDNERNHLVINRNQNNNRNSNDRDNVFGAMPGQPQDPRQNNPGNQNSQAFPGFSQEASPTTNNSNDDSRSPVHFAVMGIMTFAVSILTFVATIFIAFKLRGWLTTLWLLLLMPFKREEKSANAKETSSVGWFQKLFLKKNPLLSYKQRIYRSYGDLSNSLNNLQLSRKQTQTPTEYYRILTEKANSFEPVIAELTNLFLKAKYSLHSINISDAEKAEELAKQISTNIQKQTF